MIKIICPSGFVAVIVCFLLGVPAGGAVLRAGGLAAVEIAAADQPALAIHNTGQDIPAQDVNSLFEPFRRLDADRISNSGGVGLGLSIVRSIVAAHEGTIRAQPRPGGGLVVEIEHARI